MKIVSLQAENFKRLKAVEITPDGNTVIIAGKNAQGKSSVLDAIWAALAGKNGVKEVSRPIRDGESKARVVLELDDLRVERKWSGSSSTLTVGPRDGSAKYNSPQSILDKLIGSLSFDPLHFAQADAKTQVATLIELTGKAEEFERIAAERKAAYDARTDVNRDLKRVRAAFDSLPPTTPGEPPERVDSAAVYAELEVARKRADLRDKYAYIKDKIDELEEELKRVVEQGQELPGARPVDDLMAILQFAEATNKAVDQRREWICRRDEVVGLNTESTRLTAEIEELDTEKIEMIKNSKLPVDGLSFDDDGVLYNGVPFQQASAAERLRVSVAMAMAMNPNIRVIRITDGSLLDSDNLALIDQMAKDQDFQIWVERVDESGEIGVVIEDGQVKA